MGTLSEIWRHQGRTPLTKYLATTELRKRPQRQSYCLYSWVMVVQGQPRGSEDAGAGVPGRGCPEQRAEPNISCDLPQLGAVPCALHIAYSTAF